MKKLFYGIKLGSQYHYPNIKTLNVGKFQSITVWEILEIGLCSSVSNK